MSSSSFFPFHPIFSSIKRRVKDVRRYASQMFITSDASTIPAVPFEAMNGV